jgi:hypothetical protein
MSDLHDALDAYLDAIRRATGGPIPDLNPGRTPEVCRRILQDLVDDPVEELVELWSWRDGEAEGCRCFWGGYFRSLDRLEVDLPSNREALHDSRILTEAEGFDWAFSPAVAVPVVYARYDDTLVDCGSGPDRGCVYHAGAAHDHAEPVTMFASLTDAVEAARFCVEAGYWVPRVGDRFPTSQTVVYIDAPLRTHGAVGHWDLSSPPFPMQEP